MKRACLRGLIAASICTLAPSCGDSSSERPPMVFAAASLTEVFEELRVAWRRQHPDAELDLHFAGSSRLVVQIREGAPVDVFASADHVNMDKVADELIAEPPRIFARNHLAIVVSAGNPEGIEGLRDLERRELKVALCGPEVPAGRYARQALAKAGVSVSSVSDEPSVKALVSKVRLGELDAGVVYSTDVLAAGDGVGRVEITGDFDVEAEYPIAVLSAGGRRDSAASFVAYVLSDEGQAVLHRFGFRSP